MAHVWASRAALPAMLERGEGYILNTPPPRVTLTDWLRTLCGDQACSGFLAEWLSSPMVTEGSRFLSFVRRRCERQ